MSWFELIEFAIVLVLSRKDMRGVAWGLRNARHHWYNHQTDHEGVTHVVNHKYGFSIYKRGRKVGFLDQSGDEFIKIRWAEKRMFAFILDRTANSYVAIPKPAI